MIPLGIDGSHFTRPDLTNFSKPAGVFLPQQGVRPHKFPFSGTPSNGVTLPA